MEEKIQENLSEISELREAAENHQITHEMLIQNLGNQSSKDCIPDSLKQFMRKNAAKALEAVQKTEVAIKNLQAENWELSMVHMEKTLNEVQVTVENGGWKEDEDDHTQCLTYRDWKMGFGDHSKCVYVKCSTAT